MVEIKEAGQVLAYAKKERRSNRSYRALLNSYQVWLLLLSNGESHLLSERLR